MKDFGTRRDAKVDLGFAVEKNIGVDADVAIKAVVIRGLLIQSDQADRGIAQNIFLKPQHAEISSGNFDQFIIVIGVAGSIRRHIEQADIVGAGLASHFQIARQRHQLVIFGETDAAAEKQHIGGQDRRKGALAKTKNRSPFQKEIALFREEQFKAGEIDLLLIRFHLGEIGLEGDISGQIRPKVIFGIETEIEPALIRILFSKIPLRAQGIGAKAERRAMIMKGVEIDFDAIIMQQRHVPTLFIGDNFVCLRITTHKSKV